MTEQEWMVSNNPAAMLTTVRQAYTDRKVQLFIQACREKAVEVNPSCGIGLLEEPIYPHSLKAWIVSFDDTTDKLFPMSKRADLLRDIFGNPWRPVSLPSVRCVACGGDGCNSLPNEGILGMEWIRIATCGVCNGTGSITPLLSWQGGSIPNLAQRIYDERDFSEASMGVLCDAYEEAGGTDVAIIAHLRGKAMCLTCNGTGRRDVMVDGGYGNPLMKDYGWEYCYNRNSGGTGVTPGFSKPRNGLTHVRGCWAIELFLADKGVVV
jgi:hypothetical protein